MTTHLMHRMGARSLLDLLEAQIGAVAKDCCDPRHTSSYDRNPAVT